MNTLKKLIEQMVREELEGVLDEGQAQRSAFAQDLRNQNIEPEKISWKSRPGLNASENEDEVMRDMMRLGRPIKQLFHKHANHTWLATLPTVHFTTLEQLIPMLQNSNSSRDELSANAFLPGQISTSSWTEMSPIGLVIKGRITLLANNMDKVHSDSGARYTQADQKRTKMSGANKGVRQIYAPGAYEYRKLLVFDEKDWNPKMYKWGGTNNEALVDNWEAVAIIIYDNAEWEVASVVRLLAKHNIDIPVMYLKDAQKKF